MNSSLLRPVLFLAGSLVALAAPASLAERPAVRASLAALERAEPETLNEQARICEIPAPPFEEKVRGEYFRKKFIELGLLNVRVDAEGNASANDRAAIRRPASSSPRTSTRCFPPAPTRA